MHRSQTFKHNLNAAQDCTFLCIPSASLSPVLKKKYDQSMVLPPPFYTISRVFLRTNLKSRMAVYLMAILSSDSNKVYFCYLKVSELSQSLENQNG